METVKFGDGCVFSGAFLRELFGMTCGDNGSAPELSESAWPAVVCCGDQRYEGKRFQVTRTEITSGAAALSFATDDGALALDCRLNLDSNCKLITFGYQLRNLSDKPVVVHRALPRFTFSPGAYEVYSQRSRWGNENVGQWHRLEGLNVELKTASGRSSLGNTPFCALRDIETGKAVVFHVLPLGNWRIKVSSCFANNEAPNAVVELGLSDQDLHWELAPGGIFELPEILVQEAPDGDLSQAAALLHRHCLGAGFPKRNLLPPPVLYNSWLYRFTDFTVEQLRAQLLAAKRVGCELFVVDAGWAGGDDLSWGVGDWREKTGRAFHGKLRDFADEVRAAGLGFGLWMEPERFPEGVPVRAEHPEWFPENSTRIDLNIPEAAAYFYANVADVVEKYSLAFLKTDMNAPLGHDRSGKELYSYCRIWRALMEKLKAEHPGLIVENCASGALRTDLNTAQFFDTQFLSDNAHPFETSRIFQGTALRLPPGRVQRWCVLRPAPENPTPMTDAKTVLVPTAATWQVLGQFDLDFALASALAGVPGFSGDLAGLPPGHLARVAEHIQFYKDHREKLVDSVAHLLTPLGGLQDVERWIVLQLQHEASDESVVLVYSDPASRRGARRFKLRGLVADRTYSAWQVFPRATEARTAIGAELMDFGLELSTLSNMHCRHSSAVWKLRGATL